MYRPTHNIMIYFVFLNISLILYNIIILILIIYYNIKKEKKQKTPGILYYYQAVQLNFVHFIEYYP